MKLIVFLAFIAAAFAVNDDLTKMMNGFLDGLEVPAEERPTILRCAVDHIWEMWQEIVPKVQLTIGQDPTHVTDGIRIFLRGPLESLTFLTGCGDKALKEINDLSRKATKERHLLHRHIEKNAGDIFSQLKGFFTSWEKYEYVEAGKKLGKLTKFLFTLPEY